jgi:hypothetical protein
MELRNRHSSKALVLFEGSCKLIGAIHRVHDSHFVLCCSGWQVQNNAEQNGHIIFLVLDGNNPFFMSE